MIQPKPFLENLHKMRNKAYGLERRRNMSKMILEHAPNFPLCVGYTDIDNAVYEWVENTLDISYDGKKFPTFKLFSNQRINEYAQTWQHLDETGNLILNFKTITRDNNPKKGENQGEFYNIPGNRDYPMFIVPSIQENGIEAYDMYSMKQPFSINLDYTVTIITSKYDMINKFNEMVNYEFKAIDCYISPNNHFMPMVLSDITDDSEYSLEDRKYYSQSYKITVKAYIIREEDFKVTKLPSRMIMRMEGDTNKIDKPKISLKEEDYYADDCCLRQEKDPFYNKLMTLIIKFPTCEKTAKFDIDANLIVREITTTNVFDFVMSINEEFQDFENEINIYDKDTLFFEIERDEPLKESEIIIKGFDPNIILDSRYNPESSLDEDITEEEIIFKNDR